MYAYICIIYKYLYIKLYTYATHVYIYYVYIYITHVFLLNVFPTRLLFLVKQVSCNDCYLEICQGFHNI